MKKKTFISLAAVVVCLALAVVAVATASGMKIVVEFKNNSAAADELVTAVVSVKGYDTDMAGLQYEVTYNTDDMEFVKAEIAPDFYAKTVQFGADDAANEAYASFVKADASPYFSVSEASGTGTLRFVSIADSGSYADLGTNFTLFTVTLKSKKAISSLSSAVTPSTDFNLLGSPVDQGETSAITFSEQNTNPYTSAELSNAIVNLPISSYANSDFLFSFYEAGTSNLKQTITVKSSSNPVDVTGINNGTFDVVITKANHLKCTIKNVVINNNKLDLSSYSVLLRGGDIDNSGAINSDDLSLVLEHYAKEVTSNNINVDINKDGAINSDDLSIILENYVKSPGEITLGN